MTERIRIKTFSCLLRQETAYFDRPENSSSAISLRLSSNAAAFQQMVGARLGLVFETVALVAFGCIFGFFFSWQLPMIVLAIFLIILLSACVNIHFSRVLSKQSNGILQTANTVRPNLHLSSSRTFFFRQFAVEFIHNMRTIKQLTIEK